MKKSNTKLGVYIALGAGIGAASGVAMGNIAIGVGLGTAMGVILGSIAAKKKER